MAAGQISQDSFYYAGMFPSYRHYGYPTAKAVHDNNIFFTGLIGLTLQELSPLLPEEDKAVSQRIIQQAKAAYPHFQHSPQRYTFNFWKTNPQIVFPNSPFLNLFKKWHALPDDIDDTAILLLNMQVNDSIALAVKQLMEAHTNTTNYRIRNTFRKYRDIPAYSTWFGKKMPIDFDFCVLTNALYFIHTYALPLSRHDSATIELLGQLIDNRAYISHPAYISPHYARTPVLLYHIARLLGKFPIPSLIKYKDQLIADTRQALNDADNIMDQVILHTTLIWLGAPAQTLALGKKGINEITQNDFIFFMAGFNSLLPNPFKQLGANVSMIRYYYRCPAYNKALILQYLVLRNAAAEG
ncbi:hypothetical protein MMC2321_01487 [Chitinophaga sp. MM2321]